MSRSFLTVAIIALVGFGIYQFFQSPVEVAEVATSASPEAQFKQLIASPNAVPAEQLSRLCNRYPDLATKFLRNRAMRVLGSVQDLFVTGLDGRRAIVTLCQDERRKVVAVLDLNHYVVLSLDPSGDRRVHYVLVGNELLKVIPVGIYRQGGRRIEITEEDRKVVFTRSRPFEETLTFERISPEAVIFKAAAK